MCQSPNPVTRSKGSVCHVYTGCLCDHQLEFATVTPHNDSHQQYINLIRRLQLQTRLADAEYCKGSACRQLTEEWLLIMY